MSLDHPTTTTPMTLALVVILACVSDSTGADQAAPLPRLESRAIPEPPQQRMPWTPPATTLPKFLIKATTTLFDQGLADPRGCDYRAIELVTSNANQGQPGVVKTHGFVLPALDGEKQRFAVAWSGLVYPVVKVGEPADLKLDVLSFGKADVEVGEMPFQPGQGRNGNVRGGRDVPLAIDESSVVNALTFRPIKVCLLLRLGQADLAETAWSAGLGLPKDQGEVSKTRPDLTNYGVSYLTLASDWAWSLFDRTVFAHARADDNLALNGVRGLARVQPLIEARADEMGFARPNGNSRDSKPTPYLSFLGPLPELLADQKRRSLEPARTPVPPPGGDKAARVLALIRDLDQITTPPDGMMMYGRGALGNAPMIKTLIEEGDDAVEPLIEVIRHDTRLTRSVIVEGANSFGGRGGRYQPPSRGRTIDTVLEAAEIAVTSILKTSFPTAVPRSYAPALGPNAREVEADAIQKYWDKYKAIPLVDRWYETLKDDKAGPGGWLQAVGNIVQVESREARRLRGESLREGHSPTVSALIARRVGAMLKVNSGSTSDLNNAIEMATQLSTWNPSDAVPTLREVCRIIRVRIKPSRDNNGSDVSRLAGTFAKFVLMRARGGDPEAIPEYAEWVRTSTPDLIQHYQMGALEPLWKLPNEPALAEAATWLFNDPKSAWVPLISSSKQNSGYETARLIPSPLVAVPGFRKMLLTALTDKTPAGSATVDLERGIQVKMNSGWSMGVGSSKIDPLMPKAGEKVEFRMADFYAWKLTELQGSPPFEVYWPEARRDQGLAEMVTFLDRRGDRFTGEKTGNDPSHEFPYARGHLAFPILVRPATLEEATRGLAIFSNEGVGERRAVAMVKQPQAAKWATLKDFASIQQPVDPKVGPLTVYDQQGLVWQAEEVLVEGHWKRYFGFVGSHVIARVPAEELEFNEWAYDGMNRLSDGLDASFYGPMPQGQKLNHDPGTPLVMTLRLRNRSGFDRPTPIEFARKREGKVVSLRRGVEIKLERALGDVPASVVFGTAYAFREQAKLKWEPIPSRFETPGTELEPTSGTLRPAEDFDALVVDLADGFDVSKPGLYRLTLSFSRESGVAEGSLYPSTFFVGELPPKLPVPIESENQSY